jgi:hypothetical protein
VVVTFTEITRAKALEAELRTEVSGKPRGSEPRPKT